MAEIWRYPVKSMAGERLDSCLIAETGLLGDRRWALVDGTPNRAGKLFTNTQDARLMTYHARLPRLNDSRVEVTTPSGETRHLDDDLVADIVAHTGRPLELRDTAGLNFDDSPVLVVNLAAVAAFDSRRASRSIAVGSAPTSTSTVSSRRRSFAGWVGASAPAMRSSRSSADANAASSSPATQTRPRPRPSCCACSPRQARRAWASTAASHDRALSPSATSAEH
jgi:hypothetical protein